VTPLEIFAQEKKERLARQGRDEALKKAAENFMAESLRARYSYNFSWLGRPIIQYPEDVMALQEIVWSVRPRLIIETGVAHGGSVILSASLLEMLGGDGRVLGLDIDIRAHNRPLIENHPLARRLTLMEKNSLDGEAAALAARLAAETQGGPVMVILDSLHTHRHVLSEMRLYGPLVTPGSYLVVFDGVIENHPEANAPDRPWGPGNSPLSAIREFLAENDSFVVDEEMEAKLLITAAPSGYLRRVK
jgi:cephalosporin hydroxylase